MSKSKSEPQATGELRRRAEEQFATGHAHAYADTSQLGPDTHRLIHELQVHQIELEMQNEELKRARAEVEEGLRRYADLYEFAPVGYLSLDRAGEIRQVNLTGARLLGLERSRLVGQRLALLVDGDSRPAFEAFLGKVFETGNKESCEVVVRQGPATPLAIELSAVSAGDGRECRVVATDITARRRSETLMAVRLRLQDFAASHSPQELLQKTLDEIESITGSWLGLFQHLEADERTPALEVWSSRMAGPAGAAQGWRRQFGVNDDATWSACVRKRAPVIRNDDANPPRRDGTPDGHAPMIREVVVPIVRANKLVAVLGVGDKTSGYTAEDVGSISYLADVSWEIAERRRVELEREHLQQRLAQAQKMEALGTLAGGIAHDFNNILAGILGGLELIEIELGVGGCSQTGIGGMKALVNRGAAFSKQLLGFARRGKYDVRPLDLARVAAKVSGMYGRTRTDLTIACDLAPDLLAVLMDQSQLEQVLVNLLVNAGQAMPEGGQMRLFAENAEVTDEEATRLGIPTGLFVRLLISDTGSGMAAETMARIFEPFFTTKGPGQGTGLGLASVYGIIKHHAGFIGVESELGKGTTFTLLLPATRRQVAEASLPANVAMHGTGTILVVDDEPQVLTVCARLLQKYGYETLTAAGGKQAIELLQQHGAKVSLVVLDLTMPEMSGRQTYQAMQKLRPGIKVLLSSGSSIEGHAQELLDSGCSGFIQKPFAVGELAAKVRQLL